MENGSSLSHGTNLKFINAIQSRPCLYDTCHPGYNKKLTQYTAWEEVAKIMGWKILMCRDRWKNLRSVTMRHVKNVAQGVHKRPYYLMDAMRFILPYTKSAEKLLPRFNENYEKMADVYNNYYSTMRTTMIEEDNDDNYVQELEEEDESMCEVQSPASNNLSRESSPQPQESDSLPSYIQFDIKTEKIETEDEPDSNTQELHITENKPKETTIYVPEIRKENIEEAKPNFSNLTKSSKMGTDVKIKGKPQASLQLQDDTKKMFLLSLLPDVYAMSDVQMRAFKRGVLNLIGDILEGPGSST